MKRLLLAGLLVIPFALSRTGARAGQDDAYGSLIGMADSASKDQGPQAGEMPPDGASAGNIRSAGTPARAPRAEREAAKEDDAPSVSVPAAAAPRLWTRVFSALLPPMTRVSAFDVAASTAARRARPEPARRATAASDAGGARGLLELVAVATTPIGR